MSGDGGDGDAGRGAVHGTQGDSDPTLRAGTGQRHPLRRNSNQQALDNNAGTGSTVVRDSGDPSLKRSRSPLLIHGNVAGVGPTRPGRRSGSSPSTKPDPARMTSDSRRNDRAGL
jgi:hypothetical protein